MSNLKKILIFLCVLFCIFVLSCCDNDSKEQFNSNLNNSEYFEDVNRFCNHVESEWIIDVEATYENDGSKHTICKKCGKIIETQVIPSLEYSLSEVKQLLAKSMVKVYCYDYDGETLLAQGSGFFISKTGKFITNAHVVKDAYYVKIKTQFGATYDVDVMYTYDYSGSDHAICSAKNCFSSTPVEFEEDVSIGDTIYALGYPNDALLLSSTQGVITATAVVSDGKTYIENTAKIDHGSSGGILANSKGKVIGITTAISRDGSYLALCYPEFKYDIENKRINLNTKEPLEWFHTRKEISLNKFNCETYFNISIDPIPLYGGNIMYDVTISLKPTYRNKKIIIKNSDIYFSVEIDTTYEYYSTLQFSSGWKTSTSLAFARIYMFDKIDMLGKSSTANATSTFSNYSKLYYSYEYNFSYVIGTIEIYD